MVSVFKITTGLDYIETDSLETAKLPFNPVNQGIRDVKKVSIAWKLFLVLMATFFIFLQKKVYLIFY